MYTTIALIILILELLMVIGFVIYAFKNKVIISKNTIWFFFPMCLFLFILYVLGLYYSSKVNEFKISLFDFFEIGKSILEASIFSIKKEFVVDLVKTNTIYAITFFLTSLLIAFTLYTTILSSLIMKVVNKIRVNCTLKKNCDILIGENQYNKGYYKQYKHCIVLIDKKKTNDFIDYYFDNVPVLSMEFNQKNLMKLFKKCYQRKNQINFISFNESTKNLKYIDEFKQFLTLEYKNKKVLSKKQYYFKAEIDLENQLTIQNRILEDVEYAAFINCFNRYEYTALSFMEKNPITKNLPNTYFDFNTATIKDDVELNVLYLGFGKTAKALHRTAIMNDQIPTITNGLIKQYHINYYAYDSLYTFREDKNTIFFNERYDENIDKYQNEHYFEAIEKVDTIKYHNCDINSNQFFEHLKQIILNKAKAFNRIIVSYGEDIDNIDYAIKLRDFFNEEHIENYEMYVRIKDDYGIAEELLNNEKIKAFGNINEVFNHQVIVNEQLIKLAKELNTKYNAIRLSETSWYDLPAIKQFSNIYSSLNLRLKLNLLGYDFVEETSIVDNTKELNELKKLLTFNPKCYEDYLFFNKKQILPANALSYQEHSRWNAFYVSYGYVPMEKDEIVLKDSNTLSFYKDSVEYRKHACLTTYQGLDAYHKHLVSLLNNNQSYEENINALQTYKYDYMMLDNILQLFEKSNYRLIRK